MPPVPGDRGRRASASTGHKILQSLGAVAAWAAVVGLGTFGTFSDPATPFVGIDESVPSPPRPGVLGTLPG
jgi:hypothetical protein